MFINYGADLVGRQNLKAVIAMTITKQIMRTLGGQREKVLEIEVWLG